MFRRLLETLDRRGLAPPMSATERAALEAGDVWLDGELFAGRPDLDRFLAASYPRLDEAEQAFLDGPVEDVCRRVDPEQVEARQDLAEEVWALLREHRFFGLGLPQRYGGHGFSSLAQSTIFGKLGSCSMTLSSVVLIPNSVGPGELLVEVGTQAQRDYYLPRLARGEEIPCFALTEPGAGSDAASITSRGTVFRARDGELKIRLDWEKRYITLAPIATLLGLAVRLSDPEELLGRGQEPGITCLLVPTSLPGVEVGERHDPMGLPFPNGPTRGRGVVVSAEQIIGGPEQAGKGWKMLMEALSGGRAISLPAGAVAGAKWAARVGGAYSMVRQQFGLPIGRFEGIEEPLARIAGLAYLMEGARVFTCGAIDAGHRPAVVSAMMKYQTTELTRRLAADGMDILGGAAICRGPRNLMARLWIGAPIGITVEGANILTRTLIIFGQGVIRCHPHAHALLEALRRHDAAAFRRSLFAQLRHGVGNALRAAFLGLTRGRLARSPITGPTATYWRRVAWGSARFACLVELALVTLGGSLKLRGKLAGRFADMVSWLYLSVAALRRFEAEGRRQEDLPLVRWAAEHGLAQAQAAYLGLLRNLDIPLLRLWLRGPAAWWAELMPLSRPPSDRLGAQVAEVIRRPGAQRDRLTAGLFLPPRQDHALRQLEEAFELSIASQEAVAQIRRAIRAGKLPPGTIDERLEEAAAAGILSRQDAELVARAATARSAAIQVDSFPSETSATQKQARCDRVATKAATG